MENFNVNEKENVFLCEDENEINKVVFSVFNILELLLQAFIIVMIIPTLFLRSLTVSGDSMQNTLKDKDRIIFVSNILRKPKVKDIVYLNTYDIFKQMIVKRIIAVEGQTIDIKKDGEFCSVYVDGKKLEEEYIKEKIKEEKVGNLKYPIKIPKGHVFVMGDNRNISLDSREFGCINSEKILGICSFRWAPLRELRFFWIRKFKIN